MGPSAPNCTSSHTITEMGPSAPNCTSSHTITEMGPSAPNCTSSHTITDLHYWCPFTILATCMMRKLGRYKQQNILN